jgi:hypothetical protein
VVDRGPARSSGMNLLSHEDQVLGAAVVVAHCAFKRHRGGAQRRRTGEGECAHEKKRPDLIILIRRPPSCVKYPFTCLTAITGLR